MADLAYRASHINHAVRNRQLQDRVVVKLFNDTRPGVPIHISQHVVAQKGLSGNMGRSLIIKYHPSIPENCPGLCCRGIFSAVPAP